jgi:hypothetical protein
MRISYRDITWFGLQPYITGNIYFWQHAYRVVTLSDAYNGIMVFLGTPFLQLLQEFWYYTGKPASKFNRDTVVYFTISGIMGYLMLSSAPQKTREETIMQLQPTVNDLLNQLVTFEPYNKGLLWTMALDLIPSKGVA